MRKRNRKRRHQKALSWKWSHKFLKGIRVIGPYLLSTVFAGLVFGGSWAFALQGELFSLTHLNIEGKDHLSPREALKFTGLQSGMRILDIDLGGVERHIRRRHPEYRDVQVMRILPNEIRVDLVKRVPVAQVKADQYYLIDTGAMVLQVSLEPFDSSYAMIRGIEKRTQRIRKGAVIYDDLLRESVKLIQEILGRQVLGAHRLTRVDIGNPRSLLFWIDDAIEVRLSSRDLMSGYKKFLDTLATLELDPLKIRYVDLRFDDIVIGPR